MTIIQYEKKLYQAKDLGNGFIGHVPADITLVEAAPSMRWTGAKIPKPVWDQIVAFFQWSYAETKSETQVRLLLNTDTSEFKAHAFPQKYGTGMTAKELSDNEDYANQLNAQMGGGNWIKFGTVHHHCSAGAFQSGTDSADETEMGIHITLGNIGGPRHSIHARVSLTIPGTLAADGTAASKASHAYYAAVLSDWFQAPELNFSVSDTLREEILKHLLCTPVSGVEFPPQWAENLIKEAPKNPLPAFAPLTHREAWDWERNLWMEANAANDRQTIMARATSAKKHHTDEGDEMERLDWMRSFVEDLMDREKMSLATLNGIMQTAAHLLTEEEQAIFEKIDGELIRLDVDWVEFAEFSDLYV